MIQFTIPGEPVPKGRHRAQLFFARGLALQIVDLVKRGGTAADVQDALKAGIRIHQHPDAKTETAERALQLQILRHKPRVPFVGPMRLDLLFARQPPERFEVGRSHVWATPRPDIDNLFKLCADSWNEIFWKDDAQICAVSALKVYGNPRTEVRMSQLTDADEAQHSLWGGIGNG